MIGWAMTHLAHPTKPALIMITDTSICKLCIILYNATYLHKFHLKINCKNQMLHWPLLAKLKTLTIN